MLKNPLKRLEESSCVRESHWHVLNVNSATTIPQRTKRHTLKGWNSRNIVDSAELIHCTKKPNNTAGI